MTDDSSRKRTRAGGRAGNKSRAGSAAVDQMPMRIPVNNDRPIEPLDADGVQLVHKLPMRSLKEIGSEFLNPDSVAHLKRCLLYTSRCV